MTCAEEHGEGGGNVAANGGEKIALTGIPLAEEDQGIGQTAQPVGMGMTKEIEAGKGVLGDLRLHAGKKGIEEWFIDKLQRSRLRVVRG